MAHARVNDITYNLNSETTRLLFSMGLHANPPHQDYNLFRRAGLIGQGSPDSDSSYAITKFDIGRAGSVRFYIRTPKYGEPTVGDNTPLRETGDTRERPSDSVQSVVLHMPGEQIGTEYSNAIVQTPKYRDVMIAIREWWDHMEFEELMTKMAGLRGDNDGYEVFRTTQPAINAADKASKLTSETIKLSPWDRIIEGNPITSPTHLLNSWSAPEDTKDRTDHNYSAVAGWGQGTAGGALFNWIYGLNTWFKERSRARHGFGLEKAMLNLPRELTDFKATEAQPMQWSMMVSTRVALNIMKNDEWQAHQADLIQALGLKQGKTTGYLGKIGNIVLFDNDLCPRFTAGTNRFTRALIFGAQSMVCGYNMHQIPVSYRSIQRQSQRRSGVLRTPYKCYVHPLNRHMDSELVCTANFGSKVVSYPKPGTIAQNVDTSQKMYSPYGPNPTLLDRGRVCVDIFEKAATS